MSGTLELDCEYGLTACEVCLPQCELGAGRVSFCGDGFIDGANREYCDPNHPDFITCPYGEARCQTCSSECTLQETIGPFCGDDTIQDEEDCECAERELTSVTLYCFEVIRESVHQNSHLSRKSITCNMSHSSNVMVTNKYFLL